MDFNYNMLVSLDDDAILITNGDNDTYPGWILTRILGVRPDVAIANRSLLNTDWYPMYVIESGLPRFIGKRELDELRDSILREMKGKDARPSPAGPFGDTLIRMIVSSAERAGRPVYFAKTLYITDGLKQLEKKSRDLGLVTLVTPSEVPYAEQLRMTYGRWIEDFRTGGLDSWRLRHAPESDAGRMLAPNYAAGVAMNLESLKEHAPELRITLFYWCLDHVEELLSAEMRYRVAMAWCCWASDLEEIDKWCKGEGVECTETSGR
jgi:hypothetical protein